MELFSLLSRNIILLLRLVFYGLLAIAIPAIFILALYIGYGDVFYAPVGQNQSVWDATKIILTHLTSFAVSPNSLSPQDRSILFSYGNALIILVSLLAVIASSFSVFVKLRKLDELVPFDSLSPRTLPFFDTLAILTFIPRVSTWYYRKRGQIVKDFAARTMFEYYQKSDEIIVISGDFSWLFDNRWSELLRGVVTSKLGGQIKMLSYKSANAVIAEWQQYPAHKSHKNLFNNIVFECNVSHHKASIMKTGTLSSYIHLYRNAQRRSRSESICVFYADKEAGDLIRFAENQITWEFDDRSKKVDAEKDAILSNQFT